MIWRYPGGEQRAVIELKVRHKGLERTLAEGLAQTWDYLDRRRAAAGQLVIFDRTPDRPWAEKRYRREETVQGRAVTVWGMSRWPSGDRRPQDAGWALPNLPRLTA